MKYQVIIISNRMIMVMAQPPGPRHVTDHEKGGKQSKN